MLRIVGCCFAIGLTAASPVAFAVSATIGEPNLPQLAKPRVADSPWNELVRKALNGDIFSAIEIGEMYAHGSNAPHDAAEAMRWLTRGVDLSGEQETKTRRALEYFARAHKKKT